MPESQPTGQRFPRAARLTGGDQFTRVFNSRNRSRSTCFRVHAASNQRQYSRLGMAVSRRVDKRASRRNIVKRLIRESFRKHQRQLSRHGGMDIVVLAHAAAVNVNKQQLLSELEQHWSRLVRRQQREMKE